MRALSKSFVFWPLVIALSLSGGRAHAQSAEQAIRLLQEGSFLLGGIATLTPNPSQHPELGQAGRTIIGAQTILGTVSRIQQGRLGGYPPPSTGASGGGTAAAQISSQLPQTVPIRDNQYRTIGY